MFPHSRSRVRKSGIEGNNERYSVCVAILFTLPHVSFLTKNDALKTL